MYAIVVSDIALGLVVRVISINIHTVTRSTQQNQELGTGVNQTIFREGLIRLLEDSQVLS